MKMLSLKDRVKESAEFIKKRIDIVPETGLVLGSGLGVIAEEVTGGISIDYKDIPHFPLPTVAGHSGALAVGKIGGKNVIVQKGRSHFYEGYSMEMITFCVRVFRELGVQNLILTNAAGGINPVFSPGDLMIISDHINFMGTNPLIGPNDDYFGVRFPDLAHAYPADFRKIAHQSAARLGIMMREGVYVGLTGPSYETPAELRMFQRLGGDAVGMSTVPEVIVANHIGLNVLGISCITNIFIPGKPADHDEVLEAAEKVKPLFKKLVKDIVMNIGGK